MCLAIPGKVKKINGHQVEIEYPEEKRTVLVGDDPIEVGDYVLVQMGVVVRIISEKEAREAQKVWGSV